MESQQFITSTTSSQVSKQCINQNGNKQNSISLRKQRWWLLYITFFKDLEICLVFVTQLRTLSIQENLHVFLLNQFCVIVERSQVFSLCSVSWEVRSPKTKTVRGHKPAVKHYIRKETFINVHCRVTVTVTRFWSYLDVKSTI